MINPKIRFKRDDGSEYPAWNKRTFAETGKFIGGLSGKTKDDFGHGSSKFITYMNVFTNTFATEEMVTPVDVKPGEKQNAIQYGDIMFTQSSETVEEVGMSSVWVHNSTPFMNSFCMCLRPTSLADINPFYMGYALRSDSVRRQIIREGQGISRINLASSRIQNVVYHLPCLEEQQKIADFLSSVDDIISASEAEVKSLEEQKKGVMQKIFSQEVRFKADDGSEYPEWEITTVDDVFEFVTLKNKDCAVTNVITNSAEFGLVSQSDYFDKEIATAGKTDNYTIINPGDFVYNPRKSKNAPYGPFNCYRLDNIGIVSPLYLCMRIKSNLATAEYLLWYFKTNCWHKYIRDNGAQDGARHDRVGMTKGIMAGVPISTPCLEEQKKIADFLSTFDEAIEQSKKELEKWKELKKGLLQQMFV